MVVQWVKIGHYGVIQKRQSNKKGGKMKFEVKYNEARSKGNYAQQDFELAKIFSKKVIFPLKTVVFFLRFISIL